MQIIVYSDLIFSSEFNKLPFFILYLQKVICFPFMDRRNFLKISALCTGAAASSQLGVFARSSARNIKVNTPLKVLDYMEEPARKLPVIASVDVVVVGGGPAGVSAAVSAARQGADVMMIEKNNFLGGLWTGGLVLPVICTHGKNAAGSVVRSMGGFGKEVCDKLLEMGMARMTLDNVRPVVDPEATKYVLDMTVMDAGVKMLYNSWASGVLMSGGRISAVIVESKSGRCAVATKMVVDCSGDGDIIEWAGESFEKRRENIGMMWRAGNALPGKGCIATPVKGVVSMHMTGEEADGLDVFAVSALQQKFRKKMWEDTMALRTREGCEDAFLLETPSLTGVRITRVLNSRHNVSDEEYRKFTGYDDAVAVGGSSHARHPMWQIPYRALTPRNCPNLLVGGRCFGFGKAATYDAREIGTCLVTGQAAGTAAALAARTRCSVQDLDTSLLRRTLSGAGAIIGY